MPTDGQGTKWRRNIAENFNWLSRAHKRYRHTDDCRQATDGRATAYSEREREFMFDKKYCNIYCNTDSLVINIAMLCNTAILTINGK